MTESAARAERFEHNAPVLPSYTWTVPQKPVAVRMPLDLMEKLERLAVESYRSLTSKGSEIGGLLFGSVAPGNPVLVEIESYEVVPCEYASGPLYHLSEAELSRLDRTLDERRSAGVRPVGFFRSQTRKGLSLDASDLALLDSRFPGAHDIALVVRPSATKSSVGGFFIREDGKFRSDATYEEFPLRTSTQDTQEGTSEGSVAGPRNVTAAPAAPMAPKPAVRAQIVPIASRREIMPVAMPESDSKSAEPAAEPPAARQEAAAPRVAAEPASKMAKESAPVEKAASVTPKESALSQQAPKAAQKEFTPPAKPAVKEAPAPALPKESAPAVAKERTPSAAKEPAVSVAKEAASTAAKEPTAPVAKESAAAKTAAGPAAKESEPAAAKAAATPAAKESPAAAKAAAPPVAKDSPAAAKESTPAAAKEPARDFAKELPPSRKSVAKEEEAAAPAEEAATKGSSKLLWIALGVVASVVLVGGLLFTSGMLRLRNRTLPVNPGETGLALRIERNAGDILLTWNRDADAIKHASRAVLAINDGQQHENVEMDLAQLRTGSIVYSPVTSDVVFQMEVTAAGQSQPVSETVRVLRTRPSPMPDQATAQAAPATPQSKPGASAPPAAANGAPAAPPADANTTEQPKEEKVALAQAVKPFHAESLAQRLRATKPEELPDAPGPVGVAPVPSVSAVNLGGIVGSTVAPPPAAPKAAPAPPPAVAAPAAAEKKAVPGGQIQAAELLRRRDPEYPKLARESGASGVVELTATVGADGHVKAVKVVRGHPLLRQAAVDAVKQWIYRPCMLNGSPVETQTQVLLNFKAER